MCANMADIQSVTAESRRGKERRKIEETTGQKYNVRICYAGRPQQPFYGHYTGQLVLANNPQLRTRGFRWNKFTTHMPLLMTTSTFGLGIRR